jgi:hypothetical protein
LNKYFAHNKNNIYLYTVLTLKKKVKNFLLSRRHFKKRKKRKGGIQFLMSKKKRAKNRVNTCRSDFLRGEMPKVDE